MGFFKSGKVQLILALIGLAIYFIGFSVSNAVEGNKKLLIQDCSLRTTEDIVYTTIALKKEGLQFPPKVSCNAEIAKNIYSKSGLKYKFSDVTGFYFPSLDLIYIRNNIQEESTPYVFTHEIGHYNHLQKIGFERYAKLTQTPVPLELRALIIQRLGQHASDTEEEFVAEYFALSHLGIKFPEELRKHYGELNGI